MSPRFLGLALGLIALTLDQASKAFVLNGFNVGFLRGGPLAPFLDYALRFNRGVSFSMLTQDSATGVSLLTAFSLTVCAFLLAWLWRQKSRLTGAGIGLILGGALGNAMDRFVHGAVVDFLDLHIFDRHFFVFNVADAAISAGVVMLVVDGFFRDGSKR